MATDSAKVIPFRDPHQSREQTPAERRAARRAYREGCKLIAAHCVAQAFSAAFKVPGANGISVDDAMPIFVAAMRRELRKSGLF